MVEAKVENYKSKNPRQRKHTNTKKWTFRSPTLGLEDVFFKHRAARDVDEFKDTKINLDKYAVINYKHGADAASKATEEIIAPLFVVLSI